MAVIFWPKAFDVSMPLATVQITPVPAQAMHSRKPRRSMPSLLRSWLGWLLASSTIVLDKVSPHLDWFELLYNVPYSNPLVFIPEETQISTGNKTVRSRVSSVWRIG